MKKEKLKIKWFFLIFLAFFFIIIASLLIMGRVDAFDLEITKRVVEYRSDSLTIIFKIVTNLVHPIMILVITLLLVLVLRSKKKIGIMLFNLVNVVMLNTIFKLIFSRGRPLEYMIVDEKGFSFPSGHSMTAVGFYGFFIYMLWHSKIDKKEKVFHTFILTLIIIGICLSRVYLGAHYFTDVLGGAILSLIYLIIFTNFIEDYMYK